MGINIGTVCSKCCNCGECPQCKNQPHFHLLQFVPRANEPYVRQIIELPEQERKAIQHSLNTMHTWILKTQEGEVGIIIVESFFFYEGQLKNGKANGRGRLLWTNKDEYRGEFCDNAPHGKGIFMNKNSTIHFDGEWEQGCPKKGLLKNIFHRIIEYQIQQIKNYNPQEENNIENFYNKIVSMTIIQGSAQYHYKGCIKLENSKERLLVIDGQGEMIFPNGSRYLGSWKNGVFHGRGKYIWPEKKAIYEGCYKNGSKHGHGKYYIPEEKVYFEGYWEDGEAITEEEKVIELTQFDE